MKFFSAQYILTNNGPPVKRGIISCEDDGVIVGVEDSGGDLKEKHSVEFHNGVIVPGFVNCHCHLELSGLRNKIPGGNGLASFLMSVNTERNISQTDPDQAIRAADNEMYREGIVLCADICNTSSTFGIKKESKIKYISLLEVFGIDPGRAEVRMQEILAVAGKAKELDLTAWIVPHAVYSTSLPLLRLIKEQSASNKLSSIHFMESPEEVPLVERQSGLLMESYRKFLPPGSGMLLADNHISAIKHEVTASGNLILVHNTFAGRDQIADLKDRPGIYWCLCPNSNLRIEQSVPPAGLLAEEGCTIVIGTDSLSSNSRLSIIEELKTIHKYFPGFSLETLIGWATINGARALGEETMTGSIEPGKKPGLVLIQNADLVNMKLLPGTLVRRLI